MHIVQMLDMIAGRSGGGSKERLPHLDLAKGAAVALLVNSLGATTHMELFVAARAALAYVRDTLKVPPFIPSTPPLPTPPHPTPPCFAQPRPAPSPNAATAVSIDISIRNSLPTGHNCTKLVPRTRACRLQSCSELS